MDPAEDLIARCRGGDQRAWTALIDRYSGLVYAIARRGGLPPDACDDVAQTVFAIFVRRLADLRGDTLIGWLATTARHEAARVRRRIARDRVLAAPLEQELAGEDADLERLQRQARLRLLIDQMGERCRALLTALYLVEETPSYEELAAQLGLAAGSIGPIKQRCLAKLTDMLGNQPD